MHGKLSHHSGPLPMPCFLESRLGLLSWTIEFEALTVILPEFLLSSGLTNFAHNRHALDLRLSPAFQEITRSGQDLP